jgi:hypothetical protein
MPATFDIKPAKTQVTTGRRPFRNSHSRWTLYQLWETLGSTGDMNVAARTFSMSYVINIAVVRCVTIMNIPSECMSSNKFVIPLRNSSTVLLSQHRRRNSCLQLYEFMSTSPSAFPSTRPFNSESRTAPLAKEFENSPIFAWTSRKAMRSSPLTCMSITVTHHKLLVGTWNRCSALASYAKRKWGRR